MNRSYRQKKTLYTRERFRLMFFFLFSERIHTVVAWWFCCIICFETFVNFHDEGNEYLKSKWRTNEIVVSSSWILFFCWQRKRDVKYLRCKSSARRRDRMKEHYQPSSSINLISSGGKRKREKKSKRKSFIGSQQLNLWEKKNLHFSSLSFNESASFSLSSLTCQKAVQHAYETTKWEKK